MEGLRDMVPGTCNITDTRCWTDDGATAQETRNFNQASGMNAEANKKICAGKTGNSPEKGTEDGNIGKGWNEQDLSEISGRKAPIDQFSDLSSERGSEKEDESEEVTSNGIGNSLKLACSSNRGRQSLLSWISSSSSSTTMTEMKVRGRALRLKNDSERSETWQGRIIPVWAA
eukprot:752710-Hanusia_phi.AAC.1